MSPVHGAAPGEHSGPLKPTPTLWLDLDGTVRKGKDELGRFVHGPQDVEVFPEAAARISKARELGFRVIGITNQGGIALGLADEKVMREACVETSRQCGDGFDLIMMCPHHPDAPDPLNGNCLCRKPRIGMIIRALDGLYEVYPDEYYPLEMALFVGDRPEDEACAQAAGIRFQWAKDWRDGARDT